MMEPMIKTVKSHGNSARVNIPKSMIGKRVLVIPLDTHKVIKNTDIFFEKESVVIMPRMKHNWRW